jgi:hypothetical protein
MSLWGNIQSIKRFSKVTLGNSKIKPDPGTGGFELWGLIGSKGDLGVNIRGNYGLTMILSIMKSTKGDLRWDEKKIMINLSM